jgi:hypothetical protein
MALFSKTIWVEVLEWWISTYWNPIISVCMCRNRCHFGFEIIAPAISAYKERRDKHNWGNRNEVSLQHWYIDLPLSQRLLLTSRSKRCTEGTKMKRSPTRATIFLIFLTCSSIGLKTADRMTCSYETRERSRLLHWETLNRSRDVLRKP